MKRKRKKRRAPKATSAPKRSRTRKRARRRKNPSASAIGGFVVTLIAMPFVAMATRALVGARWAGVVADAGIFGLVAWKGKDWLGLEEGTRTGAMWASGLGVAASLAFGGVAAEVEKTALQQIQEMQGKLAEQQALLAAPENKQFVMATQDSSQNIAAENAAGF